MSSGSSSSATGSKRKRSASRSATAADTDAVVIAQPAQYDVLCGKDKTYNKHAGNQAFRAMIEQQVGPYVAAGRNKHEKMRITKAIVASLEAQYQTRFLRPVGGSQKKNKNNKNAVVEGWHEISNAMARDKTSHALRFAAKTYNKNHNNNNADLNNNYQNAPVAAAAPSFAASFAPSSSSSSVASETSQTSPSSSSSSSVSSASSMEDVVVSPPSPTSRGQSPLGDNADPSDAAAVMNDSLNTINMLNESFNSITSMVPMDEGDAAPEDPQAMYDKMDTLFYRQQTILGHLAAGVTTAAGALITNLVNSNSSSSSRPTNHNNASSQREFNTLRSEDLNDILSEPLYENGWDNEVAQATALTQI